MSIKYFLSCLFSAVLLTLLIGAGLRGMPQCADRSLDRDAGQSKNPYADAAITVRIIPAVDKTFGYDILMNGKPLIHQPHIPGLPGNKGFRTKEKARKVADFVVSKIRNNEMPPTVTVDDLKEMAVLQ